MTGFSLLMALALASDPLPTPAAPAQETGSAHAGPAGTEVVWARTLPEALERARQMPNGRLLVELTSQNCGECDRQEAIIAPSTSFWAFTRDKVPVRVPVASPDGTRLAQRFGVQTTPAWLVLTTDFLLCGIQVGPANQSLWFDTFTRTEESWAKYRGRLEQEQRTPGDLALVLSIAEETYKRGGDEAAEPRFRRVAESQRVSPHAREQALAYLASIAMDQKRVDDAEKDLRKLLEITQDQTLRERAELRLADVEIARGRRDLAVGRLRQFRKDHPDSKLVKEADDLLKALGQTGAETAK